MNNLPPLQLVSFKLCPFVQRSVITLLEKGLEPGPDFELTYIQLDAKPDWFLALSPMGKVPLLKVGDTPLFESAVINEYLDEIFPPSFHPTDPLKKAQNRAWIEFASNLNMLLHGLYTAPDRATFDTKRQTLRTSLAQLEGVLDPTGPFFNGPDFSLVDAALAPFLQRATVIEGLAGEALFDDALPKIARLRDTLLARPSVQHSVVAEFTDLFKGFVQQKGGWL